MNKIYAKDALSPNISETPEGYLICSNVPIARIGTQVYNASENLTDIHGTPLPPDASGSIEVYKDPSVLFNADTMASFEGKPVTIGHTMVDTNNWKGNAVGIAQNVHQGTGNMRDKLLADLLLTDQLAIDIVKNNLMREISLGYDAGYIADAPGKAHQISITGNHIALVPLGKAGHECRIYDEKIADEDMFMTFKDKLKKLFCDAVDGTTTFDELVKEHPNPVTTDPAKASADKQNQQTNTTDAKDDKQKVDANADKTKTADALPGMNMGNMPGMGGGMGGMGAQSPIMLLNEKLDQMLAMLMKMNSPATADKDSNNANPAQPPAGENKEGAGDPVVSLDPNKPIKK